MTPNDAPAYLRIGRWWIRVPRRRGARVALGVALFLRGLIPPTGFVLLPAAVALLSMDSPTLRRWRRRSRVWLGRRTTRRRNRTT